MSVERPTGASPFERLASHYDQTDAVCPACGYEDAGGWRAAHAAEGIRFSHTCPSCGATNERHVRI